MMGPLISLFVGSYLLGSIPFGVLVAKSRGIDIMSVGSGNIGATNVVRVLGKGPGYLVFFLDMLKGLIPALVARWLFPANQEYWFFAGMFAVIGHSLSPFLKFKGGKGISTALGMTVGSSPVVALIALGIFLAILFGSGYVSLASIFAVISTTPMSFLLRDSLWVTIGFAVLSVFVIYRHKANIVRLRNGTESKFIKRKKSDGES
ncbi:MAG TPA: glycerol-3-phosphate 1-O-acyltransferase PlsY [Fimbriimonadaceae bacterium]|nr:glycerol-3-phosphate 1-O-acyltransferase PlsY [Fimbriimonadaceae bacterium]